MRRWAAKSTSVFKQYEEHFFLLLYVFCLGRVCGLWKYCQGFRKKKKWCGSINREHLILNLFENTPLSAFVWMLGNGVSILSLQIYLWFPLVSIGEDEYRSPSVKFKGCVFCLWKHWPTKMIKGEGCRYSIFCCQQITWKRNVIVRLSLLSDFPARSVALSSKPNCPTEDVNLWKQVTNI